MIRVILYIYLELAIHDGRKMQLWSGATFLGPLVSLRPSYFFIWDRAVNSIRDISTECWHTQARNEFYTFSLETKQIVCFLQQSDMLDIMWHFCTLKITFRYFLLLYSEQSLWIHSFGFIKLFPKVSSWANYIRITWNIF